MALYAIDILSSIFPCTDLNKLRIKYNLFPKATKLIHLNEKYAYVTILVM